MSTTNKTPQQETFLKPDERFIGRIDTPYGVQLIPHRSAHDHAVMRARQLNGLLLLMTGDGFETFEQLTGGPKQDLLWLAQQFAAELGEMVDLVAKATKEDMA